MNKNRLEGLRGKAYYDALKAFAYGPEGQKMVAELRALKEKQQGKITVLDVAKFAVRYDLTMKACCDIFGDGQACFGDPMKSGLIPFGFGEKLQRGNLKMGEFLAMAAAELEKEGTTV